MPMLGLTATYLLGSEHMANTAKHTRRPASRLPPAATGGAASKQPGREHASASTRDWRTLGLSARRCCVPVLLRNMYLICTYGTCVSACVCLRLREGGIRLAQCVLA